MWLHCSYEPVSLYSLKLSTATSSGGKTLLAPTPYAFKMALLDVAFRLHGATQVEALWPRIRDLQVAYRPPRLVVVSNVFTRVLKPDRTPTPGAGPFARTIGYREYVHFGGRLGLALGSDDDSPAWLTPLAAAVSYLGKRGGFLQLASPPETSEHLAPEYVRLNPSSPEPFRVDGVLQILDDCGPALTLEQASVYTSGRVRLGRERVQHHVVLPYRLVRASKSYKLYEVLD